MTGSKGQRIGYIRVSSLDQNTQRQLEGVLLDRVFTDKMSGKDMARPQLEALLALVREDDTVIVHSMDRLARNLDDLRYLLNVESALSSSKKISPSQGKPRLWRS